MIQVKVVIPVYTMELRSEEMLSLRRTAQILGAHPVVLVVPQGIDPQPVAVLFPGCEIHYVSDEWLGSRNGVGGYNRMTLSKAFYDLFTDTEYILICQPDAYIFRDELLAWCAKGYDYIGAPLPRKPLYKLLVVRLYLALRRKICRGLLRQDLMGRAMNGGLSLRRVDAFRTACDRYSEQITTYMANPHHLYNEDIFWSLVPREFAKPDELTAMHFSFDVKPEYCYRMVGHTLPFGCHGWFVAARREFWSQFIG